MILPPSVLVAWLLFAAPPPEVPVAIPTPEAAVAAAAAGKTDFTGTWKLDLAASDSLDEMLAAQGASWVERKAAGSIVVTQKVAHRPEGIEVCVESSFKHACNLVKIGAGWEEKSGDKGKAKSRTDWSPDGKAVITTSEISLQDGKSAQLVVTRTLEDEGKTTVQLIELKIKDGKSCKARRVLRTQ